jgi:metallo-beta-lactamase family protein
MKLTFLGAAENVTGSRYLLDTGKGRILVDCGMYQERALLQRNWAPFPVPPNSIDAVVLTHAHIDHCGYLPRLVRDGFKGRIHCTAVSAEIAKIVLEDSARIQEEDAAFKKKRHEKEGREGPMPEEAMYSLADVKTTCSLLSPVAYKQPVRIADDVDVLFLDAGHIPGSANVQMTVRKAGGQKTIVFSGDIGRWDRPILMDPATCPPCDYLLIESTYGDRLHEDTGSPQDQLAAVVNETLRRGGNLVVPAFAVERAHEILYFLNELLMKDRIPHLFVFLDSPMATKVIDVFKHHFEILDDDTKKLLRMHKSPFDFPGLTITQTAEQSKSINRIAGTAIIIAGSGMCTGGRIKHHLANNIKRNKSTILFVGYQAVGTLGRQILDGAKEVRIFGNMWPVRAKVEQLRGFSAHADKNDLLRWIGDVKPKHVFVVHGEPESSAAFRDTLIKERGLSASAPKYGEEAVLS